ncbi:hypothetical protein BU16DRAFT_554425 [Lophium mytilinum]|uniref:Uncharacterized protein n=1 Tax=Lophium mytilinum TaxID=390894 RepID=A0A6A6RCT2_9PEZI|nr:hypothetical protein BU16DRAFT_554425 [Lophium mytilinum]
MPGSAPRSGPLPPTLLCLSESLLIDARQHTKGHSPASASPSTRHAAVIVCKLSQSAALDLTRVCALSRQAACRCTASFIVSLELVKPDSVSEDAVIFGCSSTSDDIRQAGAHDCPGPPDRPLHGFPFPGQLRRGLSSQRSTRRACIRGHEMRETLHDDTSRIKPLVGYRPRPHTCTGPFNLKGPRSMFAPSCAITQTSVHKQAFGDRRPKKAQTFLETH